MEKCVDCGKDSELGYVITTCCATPLWLLTIDSTSKEGNFCFICSKCKKILMAGSLEHLEFMDGDEKEPEENIH